MTEYSASPRYRHPKHDVIARLVRLGYSDPVVGKMAGVGRKTVSRIRHLEGVPAFSAAMTLDEKLSFHTSEPDAGGCVRWSGPMSTHGLPIVCIDGEKYATVARVAFERHHGRKPSGKIRSNCGTRECVAVGHLLDVPMHRTYTAMMNLLG